MISLQSIQSELHNLSIDSEILTDDQDVQSYLFDAHHQGVAPLAVILLADAEELPEILCFCRKYNLVVYPRGNGSGQTGGCVPETGRSIVINFSALRQILDYNLLDRTVLVEPGITIQQVNDYLKESNLFFPPDPASKAIATVGAAVAENSGGLRAGQFGVTKDYILALSGYDMQGNYLHFGCSTYKNVSGLNLKDLVAGSEGSLIMITQVLLRLLPIPKVFRTMLICLDNTRQLFQFLQYFQQMGFLASVMEFLDDHIVSALHSKELPFSIPDHCNYVLLLEFDNYNPVDGAMLKKLDDYLMREEISFMKTQSKNKAEKIWQVRRGLSPVLTVFGSYKFNEDICVPLSCLQEFILYVKELEKQYPFSIVLFGHLGDGNLHLNIMCHEMNDEIREQVRELRSQIFQTVIDFGGSLTGEHGIGISKRDFLELQHGARKEELMKEIKHLFDHQNLLNRGKIWNS